MTDVHFFHVLGRPFVCRSSNIGHRFLASILNFSVSIMSRSSIKYGFRIYGARPSSIVISEEVSCRTYAFILNKVERNYTAALSNI